MNLFNVQERHAKVIELLAIVFLYFNGFWHLIYFEKSTVAVFLNMILLGLIGAYSILRHRIKLSDWGFRLDNLPHSIKPTILTILLGCSACLLYSLSTNQKIEFQGWAAFVSFPLGGLVQQTLFLGYFYNRFRDVFSSKIIAVFVAAITFSLIHLPNIELMVITLIGGIYLALFFEKYRNIFAVALIHGFISLALTSTLEPAGIIKSYRVAPEPLGLMRGRIQSQLTPNTLIGQFMTKQGVPGRLDQFFEKQLIYINNVEELQEFLDSKHPRFVVIERKVYRDLLPRMKHQHHVWLDSKAFLRKFPNQNRETVLGLLTLNFKRLDSLYRRHFLLISNRPQQV